MIELVLAGYLQCKIVHRMIVEEKMHCFYQCPPLPFKKQDWKGNRWTKEQFERFEQE